jgi:subtilisin family serine protease
MIRASQLSQGMENRRMNRLHLSLSAVLLAAAASASFAADGDCRVIVGFKAGVDSAALAAHGVDVVDVHARRVAGTVSAARIAELRADPSVAYVEEDAVVEALGNPNAGPAPAPDPVQTLPWGIQRVWNSTSSPSAQGGAGVNVAVIDTGIDLAHHDLVVSGGISYVARTTNNDDNGHGTHVAGTIGARDNGIGVVGVAPKANLFAVKVLDKRGSGTLDAVASGIEWAAGHGMNVANMSLGTSSDSSTLSAACSAASNAGLLIIAAAGNDGPNHTSYPGAYPSVVAVGATDSSDAIAYFSNTGSYLDMSAPGVNVYSTYKGNSYATLSGTSMATPHVVGLAAVLWSETTSPDRQTIRDLLQQHHARHVAAMTAFPDAAYGYGIAYYPYQ